jgi:hypothetical protein
LPIKGESVCLGALFGPREDWWRPGAEVPDGSYALFRGSGEKVELVSDIVGSRTIWYAQTENLFIASTSQRAIVIFLKSFEPNEAAYPWMLSSGTLGPGLSWDRRLRCLGPDARLSLNRHTWTLRLEQRPVVFEPEDLPRAEHERRLREALKSTFGRLHLDPKQWILPLSGGYDSRAILLFLKDRTGLKAVTWGVRSAMSDKRSDAWVARELARHFGLAHEYYETDLSNEAVEDIFGRYLVAGEGRIDHLSGYMDGFAIWRRLFESGCHGVLRGDEAFGRSPAAEDFVRQSVSFTCLSDFKNLRDGGIADNYTQNIPEDFYRWPAETTQQWTDRLYHTFRHPFILAALNDLKCGYVEIINPLLSREVILLDRRVPDRIRADKQLFTDIVRRESPRIAFAEHAAITRPADILKDHRAIQHITNYLHAGQANVLNGGALLEFLDVGLAKVFHVPTEAKKARRGAIKELIKDILPATLTRAMKSPAQAKGKGRERDIDIYRLAFRAYLICRMHMLLSQDAKLLLLD